MQDAWPCNVDRQTTRYLSSSDQVLPGAGIMVTAINAELPRHEASAGESEAFETAFR